MQDAFEVTGGKALNGTIVPQGAKNETLQILSAVLLTDEEMTISNVPDILDVQRLINLLDGLGVRVERKAPDTYVFQANNVNLDVFSSDDFQRDARKIRGSVMLIGPLLARFGRAYLPKPGGDKIGRRRLDTHFHGFQKLGAKFRYDEENGNYLLEADKLKGTYVLMDEISVTGTANMVMAAVLSEGTTQIYNAACEPYLQQLCRMLNAMGANIEGVGSNLLTIHGVDRLGGTAHRILPDFIEIGSFIGLAAMTQSDITIQGCAINELGNTLRTFRNMGIEMNINGDDIHIPAQKEYEIQTFIDGSIMTIYDSPWPGFTPDLMSIILVYSSRCCFIDCCYVR